MIACDAQVDYYSKMKQITQDHLEKLNEERKLK